MNSIIANTSMPTALVTGATGFIGGRLAECLVEQGWAVKLLVRNADKLTPSLKTAADIVVGDLADAAALARAVSQVDIIFHCAANVNTWDSWSAYYQANVLGVKNLLQAIAKQNPDLSRLVHVSSVDVYGFPVIPSTEGGQLSGAGFGYGESKLQGELLVREFCTAVGMPFTIIRPANVIGPDSQFIKRIGAELKSGIMLTIDGGQANAGLIYIDNLVDYLIWAACAANSVGECYTTRDAYDVKWTIFLEQFKTSIAGKGIVINLSFSFADLFAKGFEYFYRVFLPGREPMLHRLLVRFFGRTCGHSAEKIQNHSAYLGKIKFDQAMALSCSWFLAQSK